MSQTSNSGDSDGMEDVADQVRARGRRIHQGPALLELLDLSHHVPRCSRLLRL